MKDGEESKWLEGGYNTNFQYIYVSIMNSSTVKTLTFNVAESWKYKVSSMLFTLELYQGMSM